MSESVQGVIHGRTIELLADPGIADGQFVEVVLRVVPRGGAWGEGIRETAGAFANDPEFNDVMTEVQSHRESATDREVAE